jgi:hypothetical protein
VSAFNDSAPEPREGWSIRILPGDRDVHYYRISYSLCGRVPPYEGSLEPDDMHSPDDCKACRRVLDREAREQGFPDQETEALMQEELRIEMRDIEGGS